MNHDKDAIAAAANYILKNYAHNCLSIEAALDGAWKPERNLFLAGVKWREENPKHVSNKIEERLRDFAFETGVLNERERIRERLREVRALVDKSYFTHGSDYEANALVIIDELLGEK